MSDGELRSVQFRREREAAWRELETLVTAVERRGMRALDAADARRLAMLYRGTLSALSVARAISLDRNLVEWLEALCGRAYLCVYSSKRNGGAALAEFFLSWFPQQMRRLRWHLLLAFVFMAAGGLAGFLLTLADMDLFYSFMPGGMAMGRNPAASTEFLRSGLYDPGLTDDSLSAFASFLFSHNARIGLACFALGFVFGLPVFYLLFYNGLSLGAFAALYHSRGLSVDLWGWLLPHGVTELFAVVVSGACGLVLAQALLFPDRHSRLDTLRIRGREAAGVALGAVALFFIAALFEGFFRQLVMDVEVRYLTAMAVAAFWLLYFLVLGRRGVRA
ncbi:MAG: stage II sporulation protein M [bacterium]